MAVTVDAHQHFWDTTSGRFDYYWMTRRPRRHQGCPRPGRSCARSSPSGASTGPWWCRPSRASRRRRSSWPRPRRPTSWPAWSAGSTSPTRPWATPSPGCGPARTGDGWSASAIRSTTSRTPSGSCGPDVKRGLKAVEEAGLAYDVLVRSRELPAALEIVARLPGQPLRRRPHRQARHQDRRDRALGLAHAAPGGLPERLGQGLGHDHRGRLGALDAGRPGALRAAAPGVVRPTPAPLRLGLAGVHDGRQLRPGLRRGRARPRATSPTTSAAGSSVAAPSRPTGWTSAAERMSRVARSIRAKGGEP